MVEQNISILTMNICADFRWHFLEQTLLLAIKSNFKLQFPLNRHQIQKPDSNESKTKRFVIVR